MRGRLKWGSLLFSVLVAALGVVLILNNFQVLSWEVWRDVVRLWPLALVAGGAWLFFRHLRGDGHAQ